MTTATRTRGDVERDLRSKVQAIRENQPDDDWWHIAHKQLDMLLDEWQALA